MIRKNIYTNSDTFVSSAYPNDNFSSENFLLVEKKEEWGCKDKIANSLMKFNLNIHDCGCGYKILEAELKLYVKKLNANCSCKNVNIDILYNEESFNPEVVTYNNAPSTKSFKKNIMISDDCVGKYISIKITDLVSKLVKGTIKNNGITIAISDNSIGEVVFASS